jgi:hypothetical protein
MRSTAELLTEISEAKEEAERRMNEDWDDPTEMDPNADEERFWKARWCILDTVEQYLTGKTSTLKIGVWVREI